MLFILPLILTGLKALAPLAIRTIGGALIGKVAAGIGGGSIIQSGPVVDELVDEEEEFLEGEEEEFEEEEEEEEEFIPAPIPRSVTRVIGAQPGAVSVEFPRRRFGGRQER